MAEYGADGSLQQALDDQPDRAAPGADSAEHGSAPDPWYRNRVLLALWVLMVALLVTLVIYGIVALSRGGESGGPTTTTPSTTPSQSSSTTTPAVTTTTPTTTEPAPPPETPEQTPGEAPPPPNYSPAPAEPPGHHHHVPHIPSTITLPHTVITLPHGF